MGYYSEDGTEIDVSSLLIPDKCFKCKLYISKDPKDIMEFTLEWEENMFCTLCRIEQLGDDEFYCSHYIYDSRWKKRVN